MNQQLGDEPLVVADHVVVLQRRLEQRVQHVEAGLVGGKPGPLDLHAAEGPHRHLAIRLAAPGAAPVVQPDHFLGSLLDERLHGVLVWQPVPTRDGVVSVIVEAVV